MLKYNSYKIFQDKIGNQYLYLIDNNAIFLLDEKSKKMLSLEGLKFNDAYVELSDIMTKEEFQTLFDNMVRAGLIVSDKGPVLKEEKKEEITLNGLTLMIIEYSCAITPQVRQAGNRLSGLTETAYASLLA